MKEHRGQSAKADEKMSGRALKNHQAKEETMSLNRKAMVLAVGAALAAPGAYAQIKSPAGSDWELYGKFYPELTSTSGSGATSVGEPVATLARTPSGGGAIIHRWEMQPSNTYFGFRASRDLGGGMKAIAQIEQSDPLDE